MGNFLNGLIGVYASDQCDAAGSTTQQIGADGYDVYTTGGQAMAVVICNAAHTDRAYTAQQQAFNTDVWACQKVEPTATDTAIPPTSTNTVVPPTATNTAIPATLADTRAIGSVRVTGSAPGELSVSWDAPRETVRDYRLRWTKVGENYPAWSDLNFNAYPAASAYTIVGLEAGERYKVHVRARFAQGSGPWAREVQAEVMASVPATETTTNTPTITTTDTATDVPTDTAIAPPDTEVPPPNTATSTATSTPTNTATSTPTNTATDMPTNTATSTPTNTAVPPTNTSVPSVGPREIASVWLDGDPGGAFDVRWSAPSDTPVDYRISWARDGEDYPSWRDTNGNGYPVANTYTITGLDVNACYKVRVRARYDGSAGGWTEVQGRISGAC